MPRPRPEDISSAGQDSFLDVVTNIVGILIILVMLVGGRARQVVQTADPVRGERVAAIEQEIDLLDQQVAVTESEVEELAAQGRTVAMAAALAGESRLHLATAVSAARVHVERVKRETDVAQVKAAEAAARRKELETEIERCRLEAEGLAHLPATTQEVLAYPTPVGRTVTGEEIHFRLAEGRIAFIPIEELFELAKSQTRRHSGSIAEMASRIESVGPVGGFTLDYVIEAKIDQARGQVLIRSREWVVRPVGVGNGETTAEALGPQSRFHRQIAGVTPETTVTLWCYPDSFETYRAIREELHRLGIPTACRPMPEDAPIGGSTEGSKSVVQ
ncbi:MAG: hypothetical protein EBX36_08735 [Planctomycetia bacterium]|nr:hypothetical protein [Planctomycetia bacterium]